MLRQHPFDGLLVTGAFALHHCLQIEQAIPHRGKRGAQSFQKPRASLAFDAGGKFSIECFANTESRQAAPAVFPDHCRTGTCFECMVTPIPHTPFVSEDRIAEPDQKQAPCRKHQQAPDSQHRETSHTVWVFMHSLTHGPIIQPTAMGTPNRVPMIATSRNTVIPMPDHLTSSWEAVWNQHAGTVP